MPSLSVCLLLDADADRAVRRLWRRLEEDGVPTLASHTHRRHVPHLTLADVGVAELDAVRNAVAPLPRDPLRTELVALGVFTRSRCSLVPVPSQELLARQRSAADALAAAGLAVSPHYRPSGWLPHLTLGPRLPVESLTQVARRVFDILPLAATLERTAVVDTSSGSVHPAPGG